MAIQILKRGYMKTYLYVTTLIIILSTSAAKADDYIWGEEFQTGDIVSAETFNQIFDSLEKLNRTIKDSDLVGTWSCSSLWAGTNTSAGLTQNSTNTWLFSLKGAQLTMTASEESTSFPAGYSFSTSAPNPFSSNSSETAVSGNYILFNNTMVSKGILTGNNYITHTVDIVSDDRIIFSTNNTSSNLAKVIVCDSAAAVPAAPMATAATNAQTVVNVTWTDKSSNETGFKIYRRLTSETQATQVGAETASPYVDSDLTEGQNAYYSVSAYNSNGDSSKSKVATATLDSIPPTITLHSPLAEEIISRDDREITISFSEYVETFCPDGDEYDMMTCPTLGNGAVQGTILVDGRTRTLNIGSVGNGWGGSLTISGTMLGSAELLDEDQTITINIDKNWIRDINGNHMVSDYGFSFDVGSEVNNPNCPPNC